MFYSTNLTVSGLSILFKILVGLVLGHWWNSKGTTNNYDFITVVKSTSELNVSNKWTSLFRVKTWTISSCSEPVVQFETSIQFLLLWELCQRTETRCYSKYIEQGNRLNQEKRYYRKRGLFSSVVVLDYVPATRA